jgi:hypothetical protein
MGEIHQTMFELAMLAAGCAWKSAEITPTYVSPFI